MNNNPISYNINPIKLRYTRFWFKTGVLFKKKACTKFLFKIAPDIHNIDVFYGYQPKE